MRGIRAGEEVRGQSLTLSFSSYFLLLFLFVFCSF